MPKFRQIAIDMLRVMIFYLTADARRHAQTVFFPPADLSGGKPVCPAGKQVLNEVPLFSNGKY
jgi:hypothetical protein